MSSYSYLFKYIVIGDTSKIIRDRYRCGKIMHITSIFGEKV